MTNFATTYKHIADILSFEVSDNKLERTITKTPFNWDPIVVEGSKHLVLPTIYCRLKAKELLFALPNELVNYLEEITNINRNRNKAILKQVSSISELLNKQKIEHVFLKGTALLVSNSYNDIGERMIGDIDILISQHQLNKAFNLLKENGYRASNQPLGHKFFEHKHLPRLTTNKEICAVELHRRLFVSYHDNELTTINVLKNRQTKNGITIPSNTHLLRHNILNYQVNDNGNFYNSINLRSAFDTIILLNRYDLDEIWINQKRIIFKYFNLLALFFEDVEKQPTIKKSLLASFYLFKLKHTTFYKYWNKVLGFIRFLWIAPSRIQYFLSNKAYRKALIRDRKRIYKYFRSFMFKPKSFL